MSFFMPFLCHFCVIFVISKIRASIWNVFYQIPLTWCKTYHRVRSFLSIECLTPWPRSMAIRSRIARRSIRSWHSSLSWAKFSLKLLLMPAKLRKFVIKVRSPFSTNRSLDTVENPDKGYWVQMLEIVCPLLKSMSFWFSVFLNILCWA